MVGRVVEVGHAVRVARLGDRAAVPFQVSCGECEHCRCGISAGCKQGGMYGIGAAGGGFGGALADHVLVPFADAMLLRLPDGIAPAVAAGAPDNIADAWRGIAPPLGERPGGRVLTLAGEGANSIPCMRSRLPGRAAPAPWRCSRPARIWARARRRWTPRWLWSSAGPRATAAPTLSSRAPTTRWG